MNENLWIEKLNKEHVLFYDYITENVCFNSIDYMSSVIKQNIPYATFKIKLRLGENNVKTILKNLSPQDIKLYIDTHLNCARVIKVNERDDEYTFIVMF